MFPKIYPVLARQIEPLADEFDYGWLLADSVGNHYRLNAKIAEQTKIHLNIAYEYNSLFDKKHRQLPRSFEIGVRVIPRNSGAQIINARPQTHVSMHGAVLLDPAWNDEVFWLFKYAKGDSVSRINDVFFSVTDAEGLMVEIVAAVRHRRSAMEIVCGNPEFNVWEPLHLLV